MTRAASEHAAPAASACQQCAEAAAAAARELYDFSVELAEDAAALTTRAQQMLRERRDQRSRLAGTGAELLRALAASSAPGRAQTLPLPQPEAPLPPARQRAPAARAA